MKTKETKMRELAVKTGLTFDGGDDDRLFFDEQIRVFAFFLSKAQYARMEEQIDKTVIKGKGYTVYAWNDVSGYDYWSRDQDESNYIQVTVDITGDPNKIDSDQLMNDVHALNNSLRHWDNNEEAHRNWLDRQEKRLGR